MIRLFGLALVFFALSLPVWSQAQVVDDFTITQEYESGDTTPPTTPGPLTATSTVSDQVSLSWGASTDNIVMGGYQIFRDASQIATTTLNTYTDTGLTPSTTYSYYVIAFDTDNNYSSSSNIAVATTTGLLPSGGPDRGGSGTPKVELVSLVIEPDIRSARLIWETSRYARYELRWGMTTTYELGFVANQVFQKNHQTLITDLEPNTTYSYELISYDRTGDREVLSQGEFKTLAQPDTTPPPNVAGFRAEENDGNVVLLWQNPSIDFGYVRIVRNPYFYPTDPNNGFVVYQGSAERFVDREALQSQNQLYYTAFVYDLVGNRSSGATTYIQKTVTGGGAVITVPEEPATTTTVVTPLSISIDDITIIQDGETIRAVDGSFLVDTTKPFTISAPYDIFPEHLKAIQITLSHPVDSTISYSYLLRINADKSAYEATVDNLNFPGTIPLRLAVYDYQTNESVSARGSLIAKNIEPIVEVVKDISSSSSALFWWVFLLLLLLLVIWFFVWKRGKDEDKPPVRFA